MTHETCWEIQERAVARMRMHDRLPPLFRELVYEYGQLPTVVQMWGAGRSVAAIRAQLDFLVGKPCVSRAAKRRIPGEPRRRQQLVAKPPGAGQI